MKRLNFLDMEFFRNSSAWCPVSGNAVKENAPRIVEDFILENNLSFLRILSWKDING